MGEDDGAYIEREVESAKDIKKDVVTDPYAVFMTPQSTVNNTQEEEEPQPLWLITFTDIMALMLTFFVLMYSMSVPQKDQWNKMTQGFSESITDFEPPAWYSGVQEAISIDMIDAKRALDTTYLETLFRDLSIQHAVLADMKLQLSDKDVVMSLPLSLFDRSSESADGQGFEEGFSVESRKALFIISGALARVRNEMSIYINHHDMSNASADLLHLYDLAEVMREVGYDRIVPVSVTFNDRLETDRLYISIAPSSMGDAF